MNLRHNINTLAAEFTATERRFASVLLADYPYAGLGSIQSVAESCRVSTASVTRFVQKLGFAGYQDFQRQLIGEIREQQKSPIDLHPDSEPVQQGFKTSFLHRISEICVQTSQVITEAQFAAVTSLLQDRRRTIYLIGGRMSDTLAQNFSRHLQQVRTGVQHLPTDQEMWPEYLLQMNSNSVLVLLDFRRYEQRLAALAQQAARRDVSIVLFTDKWVSPVAASADEVIALPIEVGTPWDSYCGVLAVIEALVTSTAEADWQSTQQRIADWDDLRLPTGADHHEP